MVIDNQFPAHFDLPDAYHDALYSQHGARLTVPHDDALRTVTLGNARYKVAMLPGWLGGGPNMTNAECLYLPYSVRCGYRATSAMLSGDEQKQMRHMVVNQIARSQGKHVNLFPPPDLRPFEVRFKPKPKMKGTEKDLAEFLNVMRKQSVVM